MPIYEYECNACGEQHEFIQKFSESPKRKCPSCGKSRLRKLVSAAAFHLKGSGWYVTDFRDGEKKKSADGEASKSAGESAAADSESSGKSTDSTAGDSAGKSDDAKPTKKTAAKADGKSPSSAAGPKKTSPSKSANR